MRRIWRGRASNAPAGGATSTSAPLDVPHPRYFFVHVMKTAGRTLLRHFRGNFELDEMYPYGKLDIRYDGDRVDIRHHLEVACLLRLPEERVRRIRVYSGHYPYVASELIGGDFIRLTILRHPVDRTISLLRQFRRKDPWADPNLRYSAPMEGLSLDEVYENPFVYEPLVLNHQTKIFSMSADDQLDTYMDVIDVDDKRLAIAKENLAKVDFVGLTEQYGEFLDEVAAATGWEILRHLRKNETPQEHIKPVSESLRRRIAADNAIDMEFYEYARELVESRRRRRPATA
jgi:Sulfotransferase family